MKHITGLLLTAVALLGQQRGLPARSQATDYAAEGKLGELVVAAEVMDPEQVRNEFSTTLVPQYQVIEVAFYPPKGSSVDVVPMDFALKVDGRTIRPANPSHIASLNQKKASRGGHRDVSFYPGVGVSTGSWGTGTNVGVGVGVGPSRPGPAHTDRDRRTMEYELEERSLQDGSSDRPVAGYLFFPVGAVRSTSMELVYQHEKGDVTLPLKARKAK